jgi:hypothetical protein
MTFVDSGLDVTVAMETRNISPWPSPIEEKLDSSELSFESDFYSDQSSSQSGPTTVKDRHFVKDNFSSQVMRTDNWILQGDVITTDHTQGQNGQETVDVDAPAYFLHHCICFIWSHNSHLFINTHHGSHR